LLVVGVLLSAGAVFRVGPVQAQERYATTVTSVADGDTLTAQVAGAPALGAQLIGIDALRHRRRSAVSFVRRYYRRISNRQFRAAWRMLSRRVRRALGPFARWKAAYGRSSRMTVVSSRARLSGRRAVVGVRLRARRRDPCNGGVVRRYFRVQWTLAPRRTTWVALKVEARRTGGGRSGCPRPSPSPPGIGGGAPVVAGLPLKQRVCVNTKMNYRDSPYQDLTATKQKLDYLGTDCIRDTMPPNQVSAQASRFNALDADVIAMCGGYFTTWQWEGAEANCVANASNQVNRLVAIEGMNEPYHCYSPSNGWSANQTRLVNHMVRIRDAAHARGLDAYSVGQCWNSGNQNWYTGPNIAGLVNNAHSYSAPGAYPTLTQLDNWVRNTTFSDSGRYAATEMGLYNPVANGEAFGARAHIVAALHHLYRGASDVRVLVCRWRRAPDGDGTAQLPRPAGGSQDRPARRPHILGVRSVRNGPQPVLPHRLGAVPGALEPLEHRDPERAAGTVQPQDGHNPPPGDERDRGGPCRRHRAYGVARRRPGGCNGLVDRGNPGLDFVALVEGAMCEIRSWPRRRLLAGRTSCRPGRRRRSSRRCRSPTRSRCCCWRWTNLVDVEPVCGGVVILIYATAQ
jgi:hypothetical protein